MGMHVPMHNALHKNNASWLSWWLFTKASSTNALRRLHIKYHGRDFWDKIRFLSRLCQCYTSFLFHRKNGQTPYNLPVLPMTRETFSRVFHQIGNTILQTETQRVSITRSTANIRNSKHDAATGFHVQHSLYVLWDERGYTYSTQILFIYYTTVFHMVLLISDRKTDDLQAVFSSL